MGFFSALKGKGHCGPPYTESMDHEFEGNPGVPPGGVIDETGYCKHCGVQQSYHGGGAGAGGGAGRGGEAEAGADAGAGTGNPWQQPSGKGWGR